MKLSNKNKGFTLIEILLVIAIISILAVTVFVALNPVQRLADTRDARRTQDTNSILTAIHEYIVDNDGDLPTGLSTDMAAPLELGTCTAGNAAAACTATDCVDLSGATELGTYLASIPVDPDSSLGSDTNTGYEVQVNANNQVTVTSCHAENTIIEASR